MLLIDSTMLNPKSEEKTLRISKIVEHYYYQVLL